MRDFRLMMYGLRNPIIYFLVMKNNHMPSIYNRRKDARLPFIRQRRLYGRDI